MRQRIETIADDTQNTHGYLRFGLFVEQTRRNASFFFVPPCQSELKRTLRRGGRPPNAGYSRGFDAPYDAHSTRMVNVGFPARLRYGFEVVDAQGTLISRTRRLSIENLHRIKSVGFSADFRRVYLNANTYDLSTAASQEQTAASTAIESKEMTGVARCFSCFAWRSGSGLCSCCCPGKRHLNRASCRRSAPPRPYRLRPQPCPT